MAYGDFKYLTRRTASNKILHDQGFNIFKNSKSDWYQKVHASMVYNFFDKKLLAGLLKWEWSKHRTSRRIMQTNYWKIQNKKNAIIFPRQYSGLRSSRCPINKQIK